MVHQKCIDIFEIVIRGSGTLLNQTIPVKLNLQSWDWKIRKKAISTLSFNENEFTEV